MAWNHKTIYLAGPYRSRWGLPGRALNIFRAWLWARRYWKAGYTVICPHLNSAFMGGAIPEEEFIERDCALIRATEVILLLPGWEKSKGAQQELAFAKRMGYKWTEVSKGECNP